MSELNELDWLYKITDLLLRNTSREELVEVVGASEGVASRTVRLSQLMLNDGDSRYHDKSDCAFILAMLEKILGVRGHEDRTYDPADHYKTVMHYARTLASDTNAVTNIFSTKDPDSRILVAIKSGCWDCPSSMIPVVIQTAKTIRDRQLSKNHPLPQIDGFLPSGSTLEHNAPSTVLPQPPTKEEDMNINNHPNIEHKTFIRGIVSTSVSDDNVFAIIAEIEGDISHLEKTENKPDKLKEKIKALREEVKSLAEFVDAR